MVFFRQMVFLFLGALLIGFPLFLVLAGVTLTLLSFDLYAESFSETLLHFSQLITDPIEALAQQDLLLPIPLFTLTGFLLAESGMPGRLLRGAGLLLNMMRIPPRFGIPLAVLLISCFFTPLTGASGVTIIALGGLLLPALVKIGMREESAIGLITASGSIGLLIFPSLPVILYGMMSANKAPINEIYVAGIYPTILFILGPFLFVIFQLKANRNDAQLLFEPLTLKESRMLAAELAIFPIIIVLFFSGLLTVSEIGAIVFLWFAILILFFKEVKSEAAMKAALEAMVLVGSLLIVLFFAMGMTRYLLLLEIPQALFDYLSVYIETKIGFLILLNIFLLFVGAFMDIFSAIVVFTPLILPLAENYDVSMLHLAIIVLMNLEIGYLTPPVGINLFLAAFRFQRPIAAIVKDTAPYFLIYLFLQVLITYFPPGWIQ